MALQLDFPWRGVTIPQAYVRLDHVRGGKRENRSTPQMPGEAIWHGVVGIYADANQPVPLFTVDVIVPWVADQDPFPVLYAALKAAPEFAAAVDC